LAFTGAEDGKTRYITHTGLDLPLEAEVIGPDRGDDSKASAASWVVRPALALRPDCFSLEAHDHPGSFMHHLRDEAFQLTLGLDDGSKDFAEDATFSPEAAGPGRHVHIRSWNFPKQYIRHVGGEIWAASNFGGVSGRDLVGGEFDVNAAWIVEPGLI
jgi:non-reducing end alpha-L-arabinofuranosidase